PSRPLRGVDIVQLHPRGTRTPAETRRTINYQPSTFPRLQFPRNHLLKLHAVRGEFADALRRLLRGHGVFIELEAESLLIEVYLLERTGLRGGGGVKFPRQRFPVCGEFA